VPERTQTEQRWTFALLSRAISSFYHILQVVQRSVSLSFSVLFLFAVSGVVYDLQLSLFFPWPRFTLLNTLEAVLAFIGIVRARMTPRTDYFFLQTNRIFLPSSLRFVSRISKCSERTDFIFTTGYTLSLNLYLLS